MLRDGIDMWANPLKELIGWMQTEDTNVMETGLELFCILFAKQDNRLHIIVPRIMPALFNMFTFEEVRILLIKKFLSRK